MRLLGRFPCVLYQAAHDPRQCTRVVHDVAAIQKIGVAELLTGEIGSDGDDLRPSR
jgi:hypothetical protein